MSVRTTRLLLVPFLLGLAACDQQQSPGGAPSGAPQASSESAVVYQSEGAVWVRPPGAAAVDVAGGVDGEPQHPDWSPDGTRIAFETDFSTLWSVAADGADPQRLYECELPCYAIEDPAWSPDGREVAFVEAQTADEVHTSQALLQVVDVSTGSVRTVQTDQTGRVWFFGPRWSDDGSSLVYEEDQFASTRLDESEIARFQVVTVGFDGRGRNVVASWPGPVSGPGSPAPDWSGDQVVAVHEDNLVLLNVRTGTSRTLTTYDPEVEHAIQPTFSPDGASISFTHVTGTFGVDDRPEGASVTVPSGDITPLDLPGATHVRLGPAVRQQAATG